MGRVESAWRAVRGDPAGEDREAVVPGLGDVAAGAVGDHPGDPALEAAQGQQPAPAGDIGASVVVDHDHITGACGGDGGGGDVRAGRVPGVRFQGHGAHHTGDARGAPLGAPLPRAGGEAETVEGVADHGRVQSRQPFQEIGGSHAFTAAH